MAFESLSEKLSASFKRLRSKGKLTEADVREAMRGQKDYDEPLFKALHQKYIEATLKNNKN